MVGSMIRPDSSSIVGWSLSGGNGLGECIAGVETLIEVLDRLEVPDGCTGREERVVSFQRRRNPRSAAA
jgi:hypothetical protein